MCSHTCIYDLFVTSHTLQMLTAVLHHTPESRWWLISANTYSNLYNSTELQGSAPGKDKNHIFMEMQVRSSIVHFLVMEEQA